MAVKTKKTVCIVGGGPSGLVAAKTLLWDPCARGLFRVTLFESQPRIGGLWPSSPDDDSGLVNPLMVSNQSFHTTQFSGLAWDTAPAGSGADGGSSNGNGNGGGGGDDDDAARLPPFPRAWQIGQYLERYYREYCSPASSNGSSSHGADANDIDVHLGRRVTRTELIDGGRGGWHVWTKATAAAADTAEETDAGVFDYLVVASGYFGGPAVPAGVPWHSTAAAKDTTVPIVHSSEYRNLHSLFGTQMSTGTTAGADTGTPSGGKILVVGGQFSGVEIAASIATHLSSAEHAPSSVVSPIRHPEAYSVHHVIQRPLWVLPRFASPSPAVDAPPFLPVDFTSANLHPRPRPLTDTQGHVGVEACRRRHEGIERMLGTDQADIAPALAIPSDNDAVRDAPPYVAVSDPYLEHVRSGRITVQRGRLAAITGQTASITTVPKSKTEHDCEAPSTSTLTPIAGIVLATGFTSGPSLSFLPTTVRTALGIDPAVPRQTVFGLAFHGTHHPAVPRFACVGLYRGPYWGVMEMQARLAAALFAADATTTLPTNHVLSEAHPWYPASSPRWPATLAPALAADAQRRPLAQTLALRNDPRAAQFPLGDYLYVMETFAQALALKRQRLTDTTVNGGAKALSTKDVTMDIVTPAQYRSVAEDDSDAAAAAESARAVHAAFADAAAGLHRARFVAAAVFRSLQGTWALDRQLSSRLPSHPSGRFVGTAEFRLRVATRDGEKPGTNMNIADANDLEYLYVEDGTFTADNGPAFRATRRYVWRYDAVRDRLSVWFVRTDDATRADYLFHVLQFAATAGKDHASGWHATAGHLCEDDYYDAQYAFAFAGVNVRSWRQQYAVRGPRKDYTIDGRYQRIAREEGDGGGR